MLLVYWFVCEVYYGAYAFMVLRYVWVFGCMVIACYGIRVSVYCGVYYRWYSGCIAL